MKQGFVQTLHGSILDYGSDFELLQFMDDPHIFSKFTGRDDAVNKVCPTQLKNYLKDVPDTEQYMYLRLLSWTDLRLVRLI